MVKITIPFPDDFVEEKLESEESDLDDDIDDPDWEEVECGPANDDNEDLVSLAKRLPRTRNNNDITLHLGKSNKRGEPDDDFEPTSIQIGSDDEGVSRKKKKIDFDEIVRRRVNKMLIDRQLCKHKMSLLLYLARGLRFVKIINCDFVKALSMSVAECLLTQTNTDSQVLKAEENKKTSKSSKKLAKIQLPQRRSSRRKSTIEEKPEENKNSDLIDAYKKHSSPPKSIIDTENDRKFIEKFMSSFNKTFSIDDENKDAHLQRLFMVNLIDCYANLQVTNLMELVVIFIACLKVVKPKLPIRLVNILRPITMRADITVKPGTKPSSAPKYPTNEKLDYWLEVFLKDEDRWVCVDMCNEKLDEPNVLYELNRPFFYIVTFDVDRLCVKPAESVYCPDWFSPAFKRERCDPKWWDLVMKGLGPSNEIKIDVVDEKRNQEILENQDLPTSDSGFKNHPLYVLTKHLLKFQGIYPAEVAPVGFFKDQPVYSRNCVFTLMSRDKWLRNARSVKLNETPYKVVKARPKRDRYSGELVRDLPLELFGEWQTEDYDPPEATDGIVPRNAYGNVDMYKECMLPKGCIWMKEIAGLPRVAKKLGIDVAPAVTGFDCNKGSFGSHPIIEGYIVCKEFAETLQMAWDQDQEESRQRAVEKKMKKIFDNWKKVIKAVKIREKLRNKYKD